jgi:hypothetical protein
MGDEGNSGVLPPHVTIFDFFSGSTESGDPVMIIEGIGQHALKENNVPRDNLPIFSKFSYASIWSKKNLRLLSSHPPNPTTLPAVFVRVLELATRKPCLFIEPRREVSM